VIYRGEWAWCGSRNGWCRTGGSRGAWRSDAPRPLCCSLALQPARDHVPGDAGDWEDAALRGHARGEFGVELLQVGLCCLVARRVGADEVHHVLRIGHTQDVGAGMDGDVVEVALEIRTAAFQAEGAGAQRVERRRAEALLAP
jgi:hypothetical protein